MYIILHILAILIGIVLVIITLILAVMVLASICIRPYEIDLTDNEKY